MKVMSLVQVICKEIEQARQEPQMSQMFSCSQNCKETCSLSANFQLEQFP